MPESVVSVLPFSQSSGSSSRLHTSLRRRGAWRHSMISAVLLYSRICARTAAESPSDFVRKMKSARSMWLAGSRRTPRGSM